METVRDFIFLDSKITIDGACSHERKRWLPLGRKAMTNLDSIIKPRDITFLTKVHLVKAMVLPVVMYGCESLTIKKVECWRTDLNRGIGEDSWVPWSARRSNQSILKEISLEYWLERLMLRLKCQFFGHLMWRTDSLEKTLMLGKIEGARRRVNRGWNGWMASPTRWTWVWVSSGSWWWTGKCGVLKSMGSQRVRHNWATQLEKIKVHFYVLEQNGTGPSQWDK